MASKWAKDQGSTLDFSKMDLESLKGYDEAKAKITNNLMEVNALLATAKDFSRFPSKIPEP